MVRLFLILAVSLCGFSTASATFTPSKTGPSFGQNLSRTWRVDTPFARVSTGLTINPMTEVKLDGRSCKYEDVPTDAEIVLLDVHRKLVRKIHFRTKK